MLTKKQFSRSKVVNAPINALWGVISKGDGVDQWLPFITTCRLEGEGENLKRYCTTADGKSLSETIDRIDHDRHEFDYSIYEQNMMPVENYQGRFALNEVGESQTEITWSATFDVSESDYPMIAESLEGFYEMGFEGLERLAAQEV